MYICAIFVTMLNITAITKHKSSLLILIFCSVLSCAMLSCNSKQKSNDAWVDSVLQAIDSIPDEEFDFVVDVVPVNTAVDGNFNDFLFAFLHNKQMQTERVEWPLMVTDADGGILATIRNRSEFRQLLTSCDTGYFVMFLDDASQLEDDPGSVSMQAHVHMVNLSDMQVNRCNYQRKDGQWMLEGIQKQSFEEHPLRSFLSFYGQFAADSTYQIAHVAQPLNISLPDDDDDMEIIEGTIDADQFPLFSPELPSGTMMVVDYGQLRENPTRVVMVKCGIASGMMDVLTFDFVDNEWVLTKMEE